MKIANKLAIGAVVLMLVTNPLIAVYVNTAVDWAFVQIISFSGYVAIGGLAYLVGLFVYRDHAHNKTSVPKTVRAKAHTTKSGMKYELA
jgi:hypothetical protein